MSICFELIFAATALWTFSTESTHRRHDDSVYRGLFSFGERFGDIACAVDKPLRQRTQYPLLESDEVELAPRRRQFDRQFSDRGVLAGFGHNASVDNGKKRPRSCQTDPQVDGVGVECRARGCKTVCTKCLDDESVVTTSGGRPGPRLVHQISDPIFRRLTHGLLTPATTTNGSSYSTSRLRSSSPGTACLSKPSSTLRWRNCSMSAFPVAMTT
jgi:hypothetical protein